MNNRQYSFVKVTGVRKTIIEDDSDEHINICVNSEFLSSGFLWLDRNGQFQLNVILEAFLTSVSRASHRTDTLLNQSATLLIID